MNLFAKKNLEAVIKEATDPQLAEGHHGLKRSLGAFDLTMFGIGAIIGAGIFSTHRDGASRRTWSMAGPVRVLRSSSASFIGGIGSAAFDGRCATRSSPR
jgi:APA family basic amino acid/polyamine antiporter